MASTAVPQLPRIPALVTLLVVVCAFLMGLGAVIAFVNPGMLVHDPQAGSIPAVRVYAHYFAVRNLTLAVMLLVLRLAGAQRALATLVAVVGLVQLFDFVVDCLDARWDIAGIVLILGILLLTAAGKLTGAPFWRRAAWM